MCRALGQTKLLSHPSPSPFTKSMFVVDPAPSLDVFLTSGSLPRPGVWTAHLGHPLWVLLPSLCNL
jgi:hypothetical protein